MLVLSRKKGERLMIGSGIVLTVLEVRGTSVRLGIEAPGDVPILREELSWAEASAACLPLVAKE
jgi:carbon storage regulator